MSGEAEGGRAVRRVHVLYHGHCFDGVASASVLVGYLRRLYPRAHFRFVGIDHQPGGSFVPTELLTGDVNAVVDFRYSTDSRLHWYFDHHRTGVAGEEELRHLRADDSGRKVLDPTRPSCAGLVREVLRERFGHEEPRHEELVRWADVVDAARYEDARQACSFETPAQRWALVVDALGDSAFLQPRIERLAAGASMEELLAEPQVAEAAERLALAQQRGLEALRHALVLRGPVARFELPAELRGRYPKFGPYLLAPEARYAVGVVPRPARVGVSVGVNPWNRPQGGPDIGTLCRRYGGGGHAAVGGITFGPDELERARRVADEVAELLLAGESG